MFSSVNAVLFYESVLYLLKFCLHLKRQKQKNLPSFCDKMRISGMKLHTSFVSLISCSFERYREYFYSLLKTEKLNFSKCEAHTGWDSHNFFKATKCDLFNS